MMKPFSRKLRPDSSRAGLRRGRLPGLTALLAALLMTLQGFSQPGKRLTVELQQATLEQFVAAVQRQSDYSFLYKDKEINPKERISVRAIDKTVDEVLAEALRTTGVAWRIEGMQIILSKKAASSTPPRHTAERTVKGVVTTGSGEPLV
ncbi:MAG: STN domain-containing protein, partial [Alistipes sp.]|nr:STN domain-containing protein [Alistipes sp.]